MSSWSIVYSLCCYNWFFSFFSFFLFSDSSQWASKTRHDSPQHRWLWLVSSVRRVVCVYVTVCVCACGCVHTCVCECCVCVCLCWCIFFFCFSLLLSVGNLYTASFFNLGKIIDIQGNKIYPAEAVYIQRWLVDDKNKKKPVHFVFSVW